MFELARLSQEGTASRISDNALSKHDDSGLSLFLKSAILAKNIWAQFWDVFDPFK